MRFQIRVGLPKSYITALYSDNYGKPLGIPIIYSGRVLGRARFRVSEIKPKEGDTYYFKIVYNDGSINEHWTKDLQEFMDSFRACVEKDTVVLFS